MDWRCRSLMPSTFASHRQSAYFLLTTVLTAHLNLTSRLTSDAELSCAQTVCLDLLKIELTAISSSPNCGASIWSLGQSLVPQIVAASGLLIASELPRILLPAEGRTRLIYHSLYRMLLLPSNTHILHGIRPVPSLLFKCSNFFKQASHFLAILFLCFLLQFPSLAEGIYHEW